MFVENMVELTNPLAPEKVLHCTLIAKNMGYSARITFASAGMKHSATQASASITGAARRISTPKKCGKSTVIIVPATYSTSAPR